MLEKPSGPPDRIWDTNSIWLAFLFLCLCWVAIMLLIIHRDVLNQNRLNDLWVQRAQIAAKMIPLEESEMQSQEYQSLRTMQEGLDARIATAQSPPTGLFMLFSAFEALFIAGYYYLLWRLRIEIPHVLLRVYLLTLPLVFIYFFLHMTILRYHTRSQLFGNVITPAVVIYFAVGLVIAGLYAFLWNEPRKELVKSTPSL